MTTLQARPESLASRSRTVTASAGVPRHSGIHSSVLVTALVTENTFWVEARLVLLNCHSSAILPLRVTTRQLDLPTRAVVAILLSRFASRPALVGETRDDVVPGTVAAAAGADRPSTRLPRMGARRFIPPARSAAASRPRSAPRAWAGRCAATSGTAPAAWAAS